MSGFRQAVWPLRESLAKLKSSESDLVKEGTRVYLLDLYDHLIQILELIESSREAAVGLLDLYMSVASNRMNEVMKLLTVMATLFIPVTFLAGVYGMNFPFMPELAWRWSYPLFWLVTLGLLGGMVRWFRKKGWL
jgi:magnesium transporter